MIEVDRKTVAGLLRDTLADLVAGIENESTAFFSYVYAVGDFQLIRNFLSYIRKDRDRKYEASRSKRRSRSRSKDRSKKPKVESKEQTPIKEKPVVAKEVVKEKVEELKKEPKREPKVEEEIFDPSDRDKVRTLHSINFIRTITIHMFCSA